MQYAQLAYTQALKQYRVDILRCVISPKTYISDHNNLGILRRITDVLNSCRTGPDRIAVPQNALISTALLTPIDMAVGEVGGLLSIYRPVVLEAERRCLVHMDSAIDKRARLMWVERLCKSENLRTVLDTAGTGAILVSTAPNPTQIGVYDALQTLMVGRLSAAAGLVPEAGAKKKPTEPQPAVHETVVDFVHALRIDAEMADQQVVSGVALDYYAALEEVEQASANETGDLLPRLAADMDIFMYDLVADYREILAQMKIDIDTVKTLAARMASYASDMLDRMDQLFDDYLKSVPVLKNAELRALVKPRTLQLAMNSAAGTLAMRFYLLFKPILGAKRPAFAKFSSMASYSYGSALQFSDTPMHLVHIRIAEYAMEGTDAVSPTGAWPTDRTLNDAWENIAKLSSQDTRPDMMRVGDPSQPDPRGKPSPPQAAATTPTSDGATTSAMSTSSSAVSTLSASVPIAPIAGASLSGATAAPLSGSVLPSAGPASLGSPLSSKPSAAVLSAVAAMPPTSASSTISPPPATVLGSGSVAFKPASPLTAAAFSGGGSTLSGVASLPGLI